MNRASTAVEALELTADDSAAVRMLVELVATPSISGAERRAVEVFASHAKAIGMEVEIDAAGNGIARRAGAGTANGVIALLGHIDTVHGDIPVRIKDGVLHGRGSVDAKGPLMAMLLAASRCELPPGIGVEVIAAVGEETPRSPGARFMRDRLRPIACIVGEPSGWDGVTIGYKGRLIMSATRTQDGAHTAGPGLSPADALLAWWSAVSREIAGLNAGLTRVFDQVQATVSAMNSGGDGLASWARMSCGFRLPVGLAPLTIQRLCRDHAEAMGVEIAAEGHELAHTTVRSDPVVGALSAAIIAEGGRPRHKQKTGTADFNVVAPVWRCPIAAYGPGDSALDHTPDERLEIAEFLRSIRILVTAIAGIAQSHLSGLRREIGVSL